MYNPNDPRFRRTLNTVSQRLEVANETAQISLFSLSEHCLKPCFFSVSNCLTATTNTCFPSTLRDERPGRRRAVRRPRGRLERSFDFYDDWEEDENDALLEWEAEEADRLLGDEDGAAPQPPRRGIMNYGTGGTGAVIRAIGGTGPAGQRRPQRRNTAEQDPTVIPNQSLFGFLDRLPFKLGARGLRYKPSASGLQDRPPIAKDEERAAAAAAADNPASRGTRARSATLDSHRTEDSLSSRGDIFPSDDEAEDAVALDDEFAARFLPDDPAARRDRDRPRKLKRRPSADGHSSSGGASSAAPSSRPDSAGGHSDASGSAGDSSTDALRREEQRTRELEEHGVVARREAAARLARRKGLADADANADAPAESRSLGSSSRSSGEVARSPPDRVADT